MAEEQGDARIEAVRRLTAAIGAELDRLDATAPVPWPDLPDVRSMTGHLGVVHRWVEAVLRTGRAVPEESIAVPAGDLRSWYASGREALLTALAETPPDRPCWVIGPGGGTAGFWRRRMVFENVKHLMDLRASGGRWRLADELAPADYADGVAELLSVFLPRTRDRLPRLPGSVALEALDTGDAWHVDVDWSVRTGIAGGEAARITATAGDLAMAVWERADPVQEPERFRVLGDPAAAAAFTAAPIHPW